MHKLIPVFPDHTYLQISVLLDNACNCPECYAHKLSLVVMSENIIHKPRYLIACGKCGARGPFGKHIRDAVLGWNRPPNWFARLLKRQNMKRLGQISPCSHITNKWSSA